MTGLVIAPQNEVFLLHPDNIIYWEIANELRGAFDPSIVINYLGRIVEPIRFRVVYREFMEFADAAIAAARSKA